MTYQIKHADTSVADIPLAPLTTDDTSTSLTFVGRGVPNHGQIHQTNFLKILENFASDIAPLHPVSGQQWYSKTSKQLKVWDGTNWILSQSCACQVGPIAPTFIAKGQMWYNTTTSMLMVQIGENTLASPSKWVTAIDESLLYLALLM